MMFTFSNLVERVCLVGTQRKRRRTLHSPIGQNRCTRIDAPLSKNQTTFLEKLNRAESCRTGYVFAVSNSVRSLVGDPVKSSGDA